MRRVTANARYEVCNGSLPVSACIYTSVILPQFKSKKLLPIAAGDPRDEHDYNVSLSSTTAVKGQQLGTHEGIRVHD